MHNSKPNPLVALPGDREALEQRLLFAILCCNSEEGYTQIGHALERLASRGTLTVVTNVRD